MSLKKFVYLIINNFEKQNNIKKLIKSIELDLESLNCY